MIRLSSHSLSQHGCELTAAGGGPLSRLPILAKGCVPTPPPVLSVAPPTHTRLPAGPASWTLSSTRASAAPRPPAGYLGAASTRKFPGTSRSHRATWRPRAEPVLNRCCNLGWPRKPAGPAH